MINESLLRDAVIGLSEDAKALYAILGTLIDEVAALRQTVRGLDPTFDEVLAQKRQQNQDGVLAQVALPRLDETIRTLRDHLVRDI
jgi:hypothetical protein